MCTRQHAIVWRTSRRRTEIRSSAMENDTRFQAISEAIGRTVRGLRVARGLTQEALALRVGMGWRHLQKIEAGEVNLTLRTLCRFASVLEVDISVFFGKSTRNAPDAQT